MTGMMSGENRFSEEGKDASYLMEKETEAASDLYTIQDTYFPSNPNENFSKLQTQSQIDLNLLDSVPREQRKLPTQRATYEYLRGKILDVLPEYSKKAEDHLSKVAKLTPSLGDAWLCLGNCIWKKGDLPATRNCFTLALCKGPNKRILSQLSMLERGMAQGADNQEEIVAESIKHAKETIALDVKDGNSWSKHLGNACLTCFFVMGAWDHRELHQSLKAYQNVEKDESMKSNPDLYFNSATVNTYLENYERALSGFEAATSKDPCLNVTEEVKKVVNLFDKLDTLLKIGINQGQKASFLINSHKRWSYFMTLMAVLPFTGLLDLEGFRYLGNRTFHFEEANGFNTCVTIPDHANTYWQNFKDIPHLLDLKAAGATDTILKNVEVDLDFGNDERFLDVKLTRDNNITIGKIYSVIDKERKGDYLRKIVQPFYLLTEKEKQKLQVWS
ncbi:hypothetical protein Lser_V15G28243 [Lactuca serriola]